MFNMPYLHVSLLTLLIVTISIHLISQPASGLQQKKTDSKPSKPTIQPNTKLSGTTQPDGKRDSKQDSEEKKSGIQNGHKKVSSNQGNHDSEGTCKKGSAGDDCEGEMRTCMSSECVIISGEILSRMDLTVNPCDDFYLYACGGYSKKLKKKVIAGNTTNLDIASDKNYENRLRLLELLELGGHSSTSINKAKQFYKSCINASTTDEAGRTNVLKLIKRLHSWPLSGNPSQTWDGTSKWKLNDVLIEAYSINLHPFLDIDMAKDHLNPNRYILKLSAKGLTLGVASNYEVKKAKEGYLKYVENVLSLIYGVDRTDYIKEIAQKLWRFEKSLAKIFPSEAETKITQSPKNIITLKELKTEQNVFKLHYILSGLLKKVGKTITEDQEIIMETPKYLMSLSKLIQRFSQHSPEILPTYIVWIGINSLMVGYGKSFEKVYNLYRKQLFKEEEDDHRTWYECVEKTQKVSRFALAALYQHRYVTAEDLSKVNEIFLSLFRQLELSYSETDWLTNEDLKDEIMEKIESIVFYNGHPDFIEKISEVDEYYRPLSITDDYVLNFISHYDFATKDTLRKFNESVDHTEWTVSPTSSKFYYSNSERISDVTVPMGALINPYYDSNYPASLLYGSLGSVISKLLIRSVHPEKLSQVDSDSKYSINSTAQYESVVDCFRWQYSQLNLDLQEIDLDAELLPDKMFETGGLDIAFRSYIDFITGNSSKMADFKLPTLNMTGNQQFFVGFAQKSCESIREDQMTEYLEKHSFTNQMEVNKIAQNSKEFSKAFSCPYNSRMNPKHRCSFF